MLNLPPIPSGDSPMALLDMVLNVTRLALQARHARDDDFLADTPDDVLGILVRLLIRRIDELQGLTHDYRHVFNSVRSDSPF